MRPWTAVFAAACLYAEAYRVLPHLRASSPISGIARLGKFFYLSGGEAPLRFDGYWFRPLPGYPFNLAKAIGKTSDGTIRFSSDRSGLASYQPERGFRVALGEPVNIVGVSGRYVFVEDLPVSRLVRVDSTGTTKSVSLDEACRLSPADSGFWVMCSKQNYQLDVERMELSAVPMLEKHNVKFVYYEGGGGAHDWATWRHLLGVKLLPELWRK